VTSGSRSRHIDFWSKVSRINLNSQADLLKHPWLEKWLAKQDGSSLAKYNCTHIVTRAHLSLRNSSTCRIFHLAKPQTIIFVAKFCVSTSFAPSTRLQSAFDVVFLNWIICRWINACIECFLLSTFVGLAVFVHQATVAQFKTVRILKFTGSWTIRIKARFGIITVMDVCQCIQMIRFFLIYSKMPKQMDISP